VSTRSQSDSRKTPDVERRRRYLRYAVAVFYLFLMLLVAELTGEREIIFPETAALVVGLWVVSSPAWKMSRVRLVLLLTAGALVGYLLVIAPGMSLWMKYLLSFAFCTVALNLARCTVWPMYSAGILPLLIHSDSIVYPLSVFVLLVGVAAGELVLERVGLHERVHLELAQKTDAASWRMWLGRFALFSLLAVPALLCGQPFLVVPPIIVAYVGFTMRENPLHEHWIKTVVLFAVVSTCAALIRGVLDLGLGVNTILCGCLSIALAYALFEVFDIRLPPVGAAALLPWVIDTSRLVLYPIELSMGALVSIGLAHLFFFVLPRRREQEADQERTPAE